MILESAPIRRSGSLPCWAPRKLLRWIRWQQCADLFLEVDERLLAHLEESVLPPVEIHHEGDDPTKDDDQHDGGERAAPTMTTVTAMAR